MATEGTSYSRDEVRAIVDAAILKLRDELKGHMSQRCQEHRTSMMATMDAIKALVHSQDLATHRLVDAVEADKVMLGKVHQTIQGDNGEGLKARIFLLERAVRDLQQTTLASQQDGRRALIQSSPVVLTWLGLLVYWIISIIARG